MSEARPASADQPGGGAAKTTAEPNAGAAARALLPRAAVATPSETPSVVLGAVRKAAARAAVSEAYVPKGAVKNRLAGLFFPAGAQVSARQSARILVMRFRAAGPREA